MEFVRLDKQLAWLLLGLDLASRLSVFASMGLNPCNALGDVALVMRGTRESQRDRSIHTQLHDVKMTLH